MELAATVFSLGLFTLVLACALRFYRLGWRATKISLKKLEGAFCLLGIALASLGGSMPYFM